MELFDDATMPAIRQKGDLLTGYLDFLLSGMPNEMFEIITPRSPQERGCQLSLKVRSGGRELLKKLNHAGVIADFREPDIIRVAPAPLYNSFNDVYEFGKIMESHATNAK
jgi:kynureninase